MRPPPPPSAASTTGLRSRRTSRRNGESRARGRRPVGAAVVDGRDLDVLLARAPVDVLVLDAHVGEVDLLVEVRQVVFDRPRGNLLGIPVGAAVTVGAAAIPLLQEALVLALELVVEDDAPNAIAALGEAVGGLQVGAIDLDVVLQLARLPDARVERLSGVLARPAPRLQQLPSLLRQRDDTVPVTRSGAV